jgi:hypothetical protein
MAPKPLPDPNGKPTGWNIAAALGLLAAAFLVERLAPIETEGAPKRKTARCLRRRADGRRPRPARGVAVRNTGKGMEGHRVSRYSNIGFSPSPPA